MRFPFGRTRLRPAVYPASAGTWRAAPGGLRKLRAPPVIPIGQFRRRVSSPILVDGQASGVVGAAGTVTLSVGPQGIGASWQPDQAGIATSVGALDTATAAVYVGPLPIAPFQVAQSYAAGGDAVGLAGYTLSPGEFVTVVWSGATAGSTAQLKVTGTETVLEAG
jgi:hypothetical protein